MSRDDREGREFDRLIELGARAEMQRPDSPFYTDERFLRWLVEDLRARDEGSASSRRAVEDMAARLRERVLAARLGDRVAGRRPSVRRAPVSATAARAVDDAAAARCAPLFDMAVAAGGGRELWDEPCEAWVDLPPDVPAGRYLALTVRGESMEPLMHSGDVVLVKLGEETARDSVVVARGPDDGYVLKRVGRPDGARLELCSLNPAFPPVVIPREPGRVLGTVILRWCDHRA
jgi:SOS-response transcriptional repressor LexA